MLTHNQAAKPANYRDLQIHPGMIFRVDMTTGQCRRVAPTGRGRQVRYMASPTAKALTKAMRMARGAGKALAPIMAKLDGLLAPKGANVGHQQTH